MKKRSNIHSNPYSRYRYLNDENVRYIVDPYNYKVTTHGVALKNINKGLINDQLDRMSSHLNLGNTLVVNNVTPCRQINNVDQSLSPTLLIGRFFRLFRLK